MMKDDDNGIDPNLSLVLQLTQEQIENPPDGFSLEELKTPNRELNPKAVFKIEFSKLYRRCHSPQQKRGLLWGEANANILHGNPVDKFNSKSVIYPQITWLWNQLTKEQKAYWSNRAKNLNGRSDVQKLVTRLPDQMTESSFIKQALKLDWDRVYKVLIGLIL